MFLEIVLWAISFSMNCYFLLRWLSGDHLFIVRLFNYFLPWLGLFLSACLIVVFLLRKKLLAVILFIPFFIIAISYMPLFSGCLKFPLADSNSLKVMSYNIRRSNRVISAAAAVIKQEKPDILLLQEVLPNNIEILAKALDNQYNGDAVQVAYGKSVLQAVISRYPITYMKAMPEKNRSQKVILKTPFGSITVINIHAYKHGWLDRHTKMERLIKEDIIPEKGPLVLGGDFNTNDQSETYRLIKKYLFDAHWHSGCGFGFTFPSTTSFFSPGFPLPKFSIHPVIRIDLLFFSKHFIAYHSRVGKVSGGSDHFPVVVEMLLNFPLKRSYPLTRS